MYFRTSPVFFSCLLLATACGPAPGPVEARAPLAAPPLTPRLAAAPSAPADAPEPEAAFEAAPEAAPEAPAGPSVEELAVPGFEASVLVVPPGTARRPLLVVEHGAWDRAEWHCAMWGELAGERAFVLCPRGRKAGSGGAEQLYYFPTHFYIEREIEAALGALHQAHGERVDTEGIVYAGFSQGAIMGALVVVRNPARFPRAVLIEGTYGHGQWDAVMGQWFRRGGGQRVLFACGGWFCAGQARSSAQAIERAGARARVVQGAGGHTYGGGVGEAVKAAFGWVTEGDPRWEPAR